MKAIGSEILWREVHATMRVLLVVAGATLVGFWALHRVAPPPAPVHGPVAVFTPSPIEREVQALIQADRALAASTASRGVALEQPAVAVIRETGLAHGLSSAQIGQILSALRPHTVEAVAVHSLLSAPSPAPTPTDAFFRQVYAADYAATTHALQATVIRTDVHISREEVPPSRAGSIISARGSGLSFAVLRRKQYEFDLGLVQAAGASHLTPAAALVYDLPHTSLGIGPVLTYDHRLAVGVSAVIHF